MSAAASSARATSASGRLPPPAACDANNGAASTHVQAHAAYAQHTVLFAAAAIILLRAEHNGKRNAKQSAPFIGIKQLLARAPARSVRTAWTSLRRLFLVRRGMRGQANPLR